MSEKDEDYRRQELALQEKHSRELARKSQASAEEMMMARSGEEKGESQGDDGKDVEAPGAKERRSSKARRRFYLSIRDSSVAKCVVHV